LSTGQFISGLWGRGVYAAGDVASPNDSAKLILLLTGFAQAPVAVNHAKNYVDPKACLPPATATRRSSGQPLQ